MSVSLSPSCAAANLSGEGPQLNSRPVDAERRQRLTETTRYQPSEVEGPILERWLEGGYFHPPAEGSPAENYSIAIPPPNVTGALHMGHALNGAIQDSLIRLNRMRGRNTLWALGIDHAGIATQAVVERELRDEGISRHDIGRDAFVERVWSWKEKYGSQIVEQYKRLGASCDYERFFGTFTTARGADGGTGEVTGGGAVTIVGALLGGATVTVGVPAGGVGAICGVVCMGTSTGG